MIEYMIKRKSDGKTKFFEGLLETSTAEWIKLKVEVKPPVSEFESEWKFLNIGSYILIRMDPRYFEIYENGHKLGG